MEKELTVIITMAGLGSRFRKAGYNVPKYMIEAKGKTLFEWSMDSLEDYKEHADKYIFIVRREDDSEGFIKDKCKERGINNVQVVQIDYLTDGQATTAMLGIPYCDEDKAIMIYNIDTYVEPYEMKYADIRGEGHIPCFHAEGDHWSFVSLDDNGKAEEVREKERISDNCTLGAYYFSSAKLYKDLYDEYYKDDSKLEKGEKYIAPLYNFMISKGFEVTISDINPSKVHVLGTPEELKEFLNEN
ncbi:MAG: glycosyltransferase family 2 protein [Clostridium sp.]|nr:glycosyltransferase family 2 protein [Clostridium sp.]